MASNGTLTKTQAMARLKSLVKVPRFLCEISRDGVPFHVGLFADAEEATAWATDPDVRNVYKELAKVEYIRMTLSVVADDPVPGLPTLIASIADSFQTWEYGTRPESLPVVKRPKTDEQAEAAEAKKEVAAAKTAAKAAPKAAPKATAKKTTAKKTTAKKPTARKAAATPRRSGGGPTKSASKKTSAKTPARRRTTRRK